MPQLDLTFLSPFAVTVDDTPVTDFATDKVRALLAYIALEANHPHHRSNLAGLLWPDVTESKARNNIRVTLHRLRQTLDKAIPKLSDQLLTITRQTIQFNTELDPQLNLAVSVDVITFQSLLAASEAHKHDQLHTCQFCLANLNEAASLYRGELLSGFNLGDAPTFEEWLILQRAMIEQQGFKVLQTLADAYEAQTDYDQASTYTHQLLRHDSYREATHHQLMRLFAYRGLPDQAIAQYAACQQLLRDELGVDPAPETDALLALIREGNLHPPQIKPEGKTTNQAAPKPNSSQGVPSILANAPRQYLLDVPDPGPFFGRRAELDQLQQWLIEDRCRIVAILGIGGVGKTSLAAQCIHTLVNSPAGTNFEVILWRLLLNAPPLTELLPSLLQVLSNQQLREVPESVDAQLRLLIGYLRDRRVLLVLDNMESILEPDCAGAYCAGYEPYGQLIQQMATYEHKSHLILTSRERSMGYSRLERDSAMIQSLQLSGLDEGAGHQLLAQRALQGESHEIALLMDRYSGNPLALKLVADTVDELFFGDLSSFLADESIIFDDIRTILDQHFVRLTELEQQILFWLAVEREPITPHALRQNLLRPPNQRDFLEALRGLQRRSLIERFGTDLGLQNVVTEYLTERLVDNAVAEIETGMLDRLQQQALLKAQAKDYVSESQVRLILTPIGEQLIERLGGTVLQTKVQQILADLRTYAPRSPNYAGGNLLNLLLAMKSNITGYDFSQLAIWQANVQRATLRDVNFRSADFANTLFIDTFGGLDALAIHPDGELLASSGTDDALIRLWRLTNGELLATLAGHSFSCASLTFHPAGRLLASGSNDQTIRLWEIESGRSLHTLHGHKGEVWSLAFSPDGRFLASVGGDKMACIWEVDTGTLWAKLPEHDGWINNLAYHPDGHTLATTNGNNIMLWNIEPLYAQRVPQPANPSQIKSKLIHLIACLTRHDSPVVDVTYSPDGRFLASGHADSTVALWSVESHALLQVLEGHTGAVRSVAFDQTSQLLVSGSTDSTIRLWDAASRQVVDVLRGHTDIIWTMAMSPDGHSLVSGGRDGLIRYWELQTSGPRRIIRTFLGTVKGFMATSFSTKGIIPDGVILTVADAKGQCHVWHVSEPSTADSSESVLPVRATYCHTLEGHRGIIHAVANRPHTAEFTSVGNDGIIRIWDTIKGSCLATLPEHNARVSCVVYNQQGTRMVTGGEDGQIILWTVDEWGHHQHTGTMQANQRSLRGLALSADGALLAATAVDQTIRLWDVESGVCLHTIVLPGHNSWAVNFSPNGKWLISGHIDGTLHIWALTDGFPERPTKTLHHANGAPVKTVSFSPSGDLVVSGGFNSTMRIWETESWTEWHTPGEEAYDIRDVTDVTFYPDSDLLASASRDGFVTIFDAKTKHHLQTLELPGPYEGMNITGVTGITEAQRVALKALGAVETY